jgi:serine protease DegQ
LRPGDVVVQVGSTAVANTAQLLNAVAALKPGDAAQIQVQRGADRVKLSVVVAKRPKTPVQPKAGDKDE